MVLTPGLLRLCGATKILCCRLISSGHASQVLHVERHSGIAPHCFCVAQNVRLLFPLVLPCRNTSFFNKLTAEELWKGVTSVSNSGKKRGRGKAVGRKLARNLNRGQVIGVGQANMVWPGLNAPVIRGRELVAQQQLPEDKERLEKLLKLRDSMGSFRSLKLLPIERGWSGSKMPGRSIGPPDPVGEETFEGFDTKVLEMKMVFNMKGNHGRTRRLSVVAVTGNGNGLAGFALGKAVDTKAALRKARNRAGQKLVFVERYREHTVFHDFFTQFGKTNVFVQKKPEGYGLVCHRAIREICLMVGIKDLHARVEGPTNLQHIVKAFFLGLIRQKTHEELAEEKRLHLVEFRRENDFFPTVVASPTVCRTEKEIPADEVLDFTQYVMGDRVVLQRKKFPPFFTKLPSWEYKVKKMEQLRNLDKVKRHLIAEYGEIRSFHADKHPECRQVHPKPRGAEAQSQSQEAEA
ncbi:small ribosomal subunit protein uS5m [Bacillus rossius redtenbacheri]|uniref:small ribosomal subunit protein uS5m n=1 Tax=Bacillus rossius redtenbacheri TaxID=93214 RepID=UPI002FDC8964